MGANAAKLRRYLLGDLAEDEAVEMDIEVIANESIESQLSLAESDLVEDYLEGSLTSEEVRLFQTNFLVSPRRERQVKEISLVKQLAAGHRANRRVLAIDRSRSPSGGGLIRSLLRPVPLAVGAGAIILVVAVLCWRAFFMMSPLEAEYAELNNRDLSTHAVVAEYSNLNLSAGALRNNLPLPRKAAPGLTETSLFTLALPAGTDSAETYTAIVVNAGRTIFTVRDVRRYQNAAGSQLRVLLPRSLFAPGQYDIRIHDPNGNEVAVYTFVIE